MAVTGAVHTAYTNADSFQTVVVASRCVAAVVAEALTGYTKLY